MNEHGFEMNEGPECDDGDERAHVAGLGAWARSSLARSEPERAQSSGAFDDARPLGSVIAERYVLKAYLGRGRWGQVYRARDRVLSDPEIAQEHSVALQLLQRRLSQQTPLLQKLEGAYEQPHLWAHPNVLRVTGFGSDRGQYFLATELLEGSSLRSVLDETPSTPLPEREALAVIRGVGDALKYAHAKGVVHGDIRPENVFITSDRAIKVLDLFPASPPRTLPFFVEDAQPEGLAAPDERDDVYGLACLAYELLAGRHPFNASSPLEASNAGLPLASIPRLGAKRWNAIARALALRREQRTPGVAAFLAELGIVGDETLRPARDAAHVRAPQPPPATPVAPLRAGENDAPIVGGDPLAAADDWQPPPLPPSMAAAVSGRNEPPWGADPYDLEGYAELHARPPHRAQRSLTFGLLLLLVAAAAGGVFFKSATLRERGTAWLAAAQNAWHRGAEAPPAPESQLAAVTPPPVATPPPIEAESPPVPVHQEPLQAEHGGESKTPAAREPRVDGAPAIASAPTPSAAPAQAVAPESFEFASPVVSASESRGFAAVEIRRRGGELGASSAVWWTSDGSATAPADYVSFGATIQRFAPGETTRTIRIPIVHDPKREGRKSFFVNLRGRELPVGRHEPPQRVEVVIADDG